MRKNSLIINYQNIKKINVNNRTPNIIKNGFCINYLKLNPTKRAILI